MLTQIKSEIRKNAFGVDLTRFVVVATMTLALAMGMKKFFVIFFFAHFHYQENERVILAANDSGQAKAVGQNKQAN